MDKKKWNVPEVFKKMVEEVEQKTLVYLVDDATATFTLAWQINFHSSISEHWTFLIDANNGEVLKNINEVCSVGPTTARAEDLHGKTQTINTYDNGSSFWLIDASQEMFDDSSVIPYGEKGAIITYNARFVEFDETVPHHYQSDNNTWADKAAVSAHHHAGICYEYYKETFNRNSINGNGGNIRSIVNLDLEDNAGWNGWGMLYGNGNNLFQRGSLAKALDVAAHEMSHGVIGNSAGLIYSFQSGALNESFADIFGVMVDRADWLIGEDVIQSTVFRAGSMRNLADPNNGLSKGQPGWQPAHMSQYLNYSDDCEDCDNGGVHINSGIPNHAFYLFATNVGKDKAEQVYYAALTQYLTSTSQFIDCRLAVIAAAEQLYGTTVANAAAAAFDAVGILGDAGNTPDQELPSVEGEQYVLTKAIVNGRTVIGELDLQKETYNIKSEHDFRPRISVEETGSFGVFVDEERNAYIIDLTNNNPNSNTELLLAGTERKWHKIAISRDSRRIALIAYPYEPTIIFLNLDEGTTHSFNIYNPSTGTGQINSTPEWLDIIQFDPTSQHIMYDAYNPITTSNGFWDIGIIEVWNNSTNELGSGNVWKPFTNIPAGFSIGNPIFSNTSPNRIAYELLNEKDNRTLVVTQNLSTNKLAVIADLNIPNLSTTARPCFAPDDNFIAYATDSGSDDFYVTFQELEQDHLTPKGTNRGQYFGTDAIWYARGQRDFIRPIAAFSANITKGTAPSTINFFDESENVPLAWEWRFPGGSPSSSKERNPIVTYTTPGVYAVQLTIRNDAGEDTAIQRNYITIEADNPTVSQSITLKQGWNMIASNIMPDNPNILSMIAPIKNEVIQIKNSIGATVIPSSSINNIGNWNPLEGYLIKVSSATTLTIEGTKLAKDTPIPIRQNWQIIPYFEENATNIKTALSTLQGAIILVKDVSGNSFIPDANIDNISQLQPGNGYLLKARRSAILRY